MQIVLVWSLLSSLSLDLLLRPIPDRLQELRHVYSFRLHFNHPRMLHDMPRCCSPRRVFLETVSCQHGFPIRFESVSYQHSMKYLKLELHVRLFSGSSFNLGIGCRTIYVNKSIRPALGFISVPSAGKGNRCCATSSNVTPKLQTSLVMV